MKELITVCHAIYMAREKKNKLARVEKSQQVILI